MFCELKLFYVGGSEDCYILNDDCDNEQLPPYIDTEDDEK